MTAAHADDSVAQERKSEEKSPVDQSGGGANKNTTMENPTLEREEEHEDKEDPSSKDATGGKNQDNTVPPREMSREIVSIVSIVEDTTNQKNEHHEDSTHAKNSEKLSSPNKTHLEKKETRQESAGSAGKKIDQDQEETISCVQIEVGKVKEIKDQLSLRTENQAENFVQFVSNTCKDEDPRPRAQVSKCPKEESRSTHESHDSFLKEKLKKLSLDGNEIGDVLYGRESKVPQDLNEDRQDQESVDYDVGDTFDPGEELNFYEAVRAGDAKSVATLFARDEVQNPDEPDWNVSGDPPLLVAATNHCLPVVSVLLANGCDPAVRSPRGETALHRVILNGGPGTALKLVGELLKYGCPPGVKEAGGGLTALHILSRQLAHAQTSKSLHHDFDEALKTLDLLAKAGPVNAKDHQGRSALHILASSTTFDNNHRTEIQSLIDTLLAAGADPALKNDRGETPLHECLECGALNTAFLLVPHTPTGITSRYGETPLHIASRKNYVDMVARLLEHGEDPSVQDAGGNTPLHLASARGFHQTVSLLVTSPLAQLEKVNVDGLTALQVAAESGFANAVKLLLKAGADPSQTVHYRATTLHRHPDISVLIDHELTRRRQLAA